MKPRKLASGGHATVWLARTSTGELVARKKPHPHLVDDVDVRDALRREAEIAIRLRHPNVVRLRSIDLEEEAPVLVLDYVDGATVAELVRDWTKERRTDTARAAIRIALDATEGLHALHELKSERGDPLALVHRDVSPQNVLVGIDGRARVSDFGLTKCLATDRATTEGVLKGKAGYLAPEYVRGVRGDRRQDVFSLGIVVWEMLARARLFRGENDAQTLELVLSMPIPSIAEKAPELAHAAADLDPVLARALARDPEERFPTAAAFGEALAAAASHVGLLGTAHDVTRAFSPERLAALAARREGTEDAEAPPASSVSAKTERPSRRMPIVLGFAAVAAVVTAAGLFARSTPTSPSLTSPLPLPAPAASGGPAAPAAAAVATSTSSSTSPANVSVEDLPSAVAPARSTPAAPNRVRPWSASSAPAAKPRPNPY